MKGLVNFPRRVWRRLLFQRDPIRAAREIGVTIGERCRLLGVNEQTFGSEPYLVSIGDHVTITAGVQFITHDGGVWVLRDEIPTIDIVSPIQVGANVFIGFGATLLPGVSIGDNVVIAARSVVTKSFPEGNAVLAGVPARQVSDLAAYREAAIAKDVSTKQMDAFEKRRALEGLYKNCH